MSKPTFIRSKVKPWGDCDRCGREIATIGGGMGWWNPKQNARIRNICDECHEAGKRDKQAYYAKWLAKCAKLNTDKEPDYTVSELRIIASELSDVYDDAARALMWCADKLDGESTNAEMCLRCHGEGVAPVDSDGTMYECGACGGDKITHMEEFK